MDWLFDLLVKIIEVVLVVFVTALLVRFLPSKTKNNEVDFQEFIENPGKTSKWDFIFLIYMIIVLPAIAFLLSILFEKFNNFIEPFFSNALIIVYPQFMMFYSSSLFILYTLACKPSEIYLKILLKNHYTEYRKVIAYSEYKSGISNKKFYNIFFIFLLIITIILLFVQLKSQAYFYSDKIEFFDFPTWKNVTYHYNDVSKIIHTPGFLKETGGVDNHEHFRIYFKDNNYWSSLSWNDLNEDTIRAIKLVSEKTKITIQEIPGIKN